MLEEPTSPAMYAATDEKQESGDHHDRGHGQRDTQGAHDGLIDEEDGDGVNAATPQMTHFIGVSCWYDRSRYRGPALRDRPLRIPERSEPRMDTSAQIPPMSMAPTPR